MVLSFFFFFLNYYYHNVTPTLFKQSLYGNLHIHRSMCNSFQDSKSFKGAGMKQDDSTFFRSFHPKQIIPAAPVKAGSRRELSVKPCKGGGGPSASNLSFKHLGRFPSEECSADQEVQAWNMQAAASYGEALAQDLSNQDGPSASTNQPASTHTPLLHLQIAASDPSRDPCVSAFTCCVY